VQKIEPPCCASVAPSQARATSRMSRVGKQPMRASP
jgi:hypothetical protein